MQGTISSSKNWNYVAYKLKPLLWFGFYISDRFQQVIGVGESRSKFFSEWRPTVCSVPQGSKIVPFLFLIDDNDLPANVSVFVISFADDSTVCVRTPDFGSLPKAVLSAFKEFSKWFEVNDLHLNCSKTNVLHFQTIQMQRRVDTLGSISKSEEFEMQRLSTKSIS